LRKGLTAKLRDFGVILEEERRKNPLNTMEICKNPLEGGNLLMLSNLY